MIKISRITTSGNLTKGGVSRICTIQTIVENRNQSQHLKESSKEGYEVTYDATVKANIDSLNIFFWF